MPTPRDRDSPGNKAKRNSIGRSSTPELLSACVSLLGLTPRSLRQHFLVVSFVHRALRDRSFCEISVFQGNRESAGVSFGDSMLAGGFGKLDYVWEKDWLGLRCFS